MNLVYSLLLITLLSICPCDATLLVGGVQQSNYLTEITPQMSAAIDKAMAQPQVDWFAIPKWMAGQWTKEGDVTVSAIELRTGIDTPINRWTANHMSRQFGHQLDLFNNVWWAALLPVEHTSESQDSISFKFVTIALKLEQNTPTELVTRTRYLVTESIGWGVSKQYQQEAINHYMLSEDGELQNRSYNRIFDLQGKPIRDARLISKWKKTDDFVPVAELQGIDLAKSLNYYLCANGQSNLAKANVAQAGILNTNGYTTYPVNTNRTPGSLPNEKTPPITFP